MCNKKPIFNKVEDARANINEGRYEAALTLLLVAIDGSSRKFYPDGTISIKNPPKKMGNKERFTRFLGVRIRQVLGIQVPHEVYFGGELHPIVGGIENPEDKIYVHFRCNDLHEAGLPEDAQYVYEESTISNVMSLSFHGDRVRFSSGFLTLLEEIVVGSPRNGSEFGIHYYQLKAPNGKDVKNSLAEIASANGLGFTQLDIIRKLLEFIGPHAKEMSDAQLKEELLENLLSKLPGGAKPALAYNPSDTPLYEPAEANSVYKLDGHFTNLGVKVARDIIKELEFDEIS